MGRYTSKKLGKNRKLSFKNKNIGKRNITFEGPKLFGGDLGNNQPQDFPGEAQAAQLKYEEEEKQKAAKEKGEEEKGEEEKAAKEKAAKEKEEKAKAAKVAKAEEDAKLIKDKIMVIIYQHTKFINIIDDNGKTVTLTRDTNEYTKKVAAAEPKMQSIARMFKKRQKAEAAKAAELKQINNNDYDNKRG